MVRGRIWPNFELNQALLYVFVTCNYEVGSDKTAEKRGKPVFPIISIWEFYQKLRTDSVVGVRNWPNFELLSCMSSLPASLKKIG